MGDGDEAWWGTKTKLQRFSSNPPGTPSLSGAMHRMRGHVPSICSFNERRFWESTFWEYWDWQVDLSLQGHQLPLQCMCGFTNAVQVGTAFPCVSSNKHGENDGKCVSHPTSHEFPVTWAAGSQDMKPWESWHISLFAADPKVWKSSWIIQGWRNQYTTCSKPPTNPPISADFTYV